LRTSATSASQEIRVPVPDVKVPAGATAVVDANRFFENGLIELRPDDPNLRAKLHDVGRDVIPLAPTPIGDSPPPDDAQVWDQLGPLGQVVP